MPHTADTQHQAAVDTESATGIDPGPDTSAYGLVQPGYDLLRQAEYNLAPPLASRRRPDHKPASAYS